MNARTTALSALIACRKQGAWSDGVLKEYTHRDKLDRRDAGLAAQLCYGVLQNRQLLDHYLSGLVKGKLKDLQPVVLDILRLGLYQLLFLDKIPPSAAVNEAVEQGKKYANARAAGLINGVLRNAIRQKDSLMPPSDLATRYSHPKALVNLLAEQMSRQELEMVLKANNEAPETVLQLNPLVTTLEEVHREISAAGGVSRDHPWLENCCSVSGVGSIDGLKVFQSGGVYVQDAASRLAVRCAGLKPGMRVLDACAAPGGKTFAAAVDMKGQGSIISCDIHSHKLTLIEKSARRLGFDLLTVRQQDASRFVPEWEGVMDAVIVDAPCSGLGIIRKKPDIRDKELSQTEALPEIQLKILDNQARYVRPGGVLLYSTCTILRRENQDVVEKFLMNHPDFTRENLPLPEVIENDGSGMLTLLPGKYDTDGFFICKLRRKS